MPTNLQHIKRFHRPAVRSTTLSSVHHISYCITMYRLSINRTFCSLVATMCHVTNCLSTSQHGCATCSMSHTHSSRRQWDYAIVGGGPAGFVVTEYLSRDPKVNVILLEAGPDASQAENIKIPGFAGNNEYGEFIWDYYVTPQKHLDGLTPHLAQGRLLGGGSGVNYVRY